MSGEGRRKECKRSGGSRGHFAVEVVNFQVVEPLEILPIDYLLPQQTHFFGFSLPSHTFMWVTRTARNKVERVIEHN
jgi:uncharacterized membrane protein YesL